MSEIQNEVERLYSPGEVALHMDIERQTVTKYARLFEDNGYIFHKDDKGKRAYTDTNIMMFKDLITQRNKPGVTLESAAKSLAAIYQSKSVTDTVIDLPADYNRYDNDINGKLDMLMLAFKELQDINVNQSKEIAALRTEVIDLKSGLQEQKLIAERDTKLLENLRASQERKREEEFETMKQLAAAIEEKQKKGFFARLLRR